MYRVTHLLAEKVMLHQFQLILRLSWDGTDVNITFFASRWVTLYNLWPCHCFCSASIHYHFTPCFPLPLLESKSPNSGKSQKAKLPYMGKHVSSCLFPGNPCLQRYDSLGARLQTALVTRDVQCYYVGVAWIVNSQLQCFYGVPLGERENLMTVIK